MGTATSAVRSAIFTLEHVLEDLKSAPEKENIVDLIKACELIDEKYQEMCSEFDRDDKLIPGTTYTHGINIEFYIEANWWHDVSEALRKLR